MTSKEDIQWTAVPICKVLIFKFQVLTYSNYLIAHFTVLTNVWVTLIIYKLPQMAYDVRPCNETYGPKRVRHGKQTYKSFNIL